MSRSPIQRMALHQRIVGVVVACLIIAVGAVAVWASGRSPADAGRTASSAAPVTSATPSASASAVVLAEASPSPTRTPKAKPSATTTRAASTTGGASTATSSDATSSGGTSTSEKTSTPKPEATRSAAPYFTVTGKVDKTVRFTLAKLKGMPDRVSDDYFSRGKDPKTATNAFVGVRLSDILAVAGLKSDAKKVTITAADDYSASFTLRQVNATYIDETRPGVELPMIIAWSEDGAAYTGKHPFRLVMGQSVEGDYNRQYWVKVVVNVDVE